MDGWVKERKKGRKKRKEERKEERRKPARNEVMSTCNLNTWEVKAQETGTQS